MASHLDLNSTVTEMRERPGGPQSTAVSGVAVGMNICVKEEDY